MSVENIREEIKEDKKGIGITIRLFVIAMAPIVFILLILTYSASMGIENGMQTALYDGMAGMSGSVESAYSIVYQGDYTVDENGIIYKGPVDLTPTNVMMDQMVERSRYNMILTYGDEIKITTMTNKKKDRIIGEKITDKDLLKTVLDQGKTYKGTNTKISGAEYYTYATPLKNSDDSIIGLVCITEPCSDVESFIKARILFIVAVAAALSVVTVVTTTAGCRSLTKGIKFAEAALRGLAEGRINIKIEEKYLKRGDEIGSMARELNSLREKLMTIIGNIKNSSAVLMDSGENLSQMAQQSNMAADEISRAVEDISKGAVSQAEEIEEANVYVNNMGEVVNRIVDGVETLNATSDDMKHAGDASDIIIRELSESNDKTTRAITHIGNQIKATNDSVQQIGEAAKLITAIADQTSLLALNASIEAARAGEAGKGFAVVADEIGKLADQSTLSASQIQEVIGNLLTESEKTVQVMQEVNVFVAEQQEKLNETRKKFQEVSAGIASSKEDTVAIRSHTDTYFESRSRVADVIQNLSAISQENAASTEQTTASMEELNATINLLTDAAKNLTELSANLEEEMRFFKLED